MRGRSTRAGYGRARHMVFVRAVAVYDAGLAGEDARSASFLSNHAVDHRLRNSILLGGADDHVWLPLHAGTPAGSRNQKSEWLEREEGRQRTLPPGVHSRAGARCRAAENVEDQR